ncbi:hypothetical protein BJ944DRAFT_245301 [Cunninghamella echinulata]|nr:hypothetical protein BJ944DRAFT_245301 [Cunninghamella echinulata]
MSSPLPVNAKQNWSNNNSDDNNNTNEGNTSQSVGDILEDVASSYHDRTITTARLGSSPAPPHMRYNEDLLNDDTLSHRSYGSTTTDLEQVLTNHSGTLLFRPLSTPSYNYEDNTVSADLPDEKIAKVVKRHLAGASSPGGGSVSSPGSASPRRSVYDGGLSRVTTNNSYQAGSTQNMEQDDFLDDLPSSSSLLNNAHQLPGGAITHDIYKWTEDIEALKHKRQRSQSVYLPRQEPTEPTLAHLKDPGGFRRHFVVHKANQEGKKPPHWMTRTFVDFLALYGHFGGEDLSEDEDDEDEMDDEELFIEEGISEDVLRRRKAGRHGRRQGDEGGDDGQDELSPLIRKAQANAVQGTATPAKAVFLLLKSFVGTGMFF